MGEVHWGDLGSAPDDMDDEEIVEVIRRDFDSFEEEAVYGKYSKSDACPECYLIHKGECL